MICKCDTTLRAFSESISVNEMNERIGRIANAGYAKGDLISAKAKTRKYRDINFWGYNIVSKEPDCVESCLNQMCALILSIPSYITLENEIQLDIFTGVFSMDSQINFFIPAELAKVSGNANIDHLISCYPETPTE